jgi:thiamine biosynthesis lipoprotein
MDRRQVLKLFGISLLSLKTFGNNRAWASMVGLGDQGPEIVKGSRIMMGNIPVEVTVVSDDRDQAQQAIGAAFSEMQRLENLMSIFKLDSEFSQLNTFAGEKPVLLSSEMIEVLKRGVEVTRLTEGAFNIAIGSAVRLWDFLGKKHVPTSKEIGTIRSLCDPEDISIDERNRKVFLRKKGMMVDPGGIGKGYIAERARLVLKEQGISSGIIAAAGDLVLFGTRPDGQPWRIGVRHPRKKNEMIAFINLTDCAISTSGDYERFFTENGVIYHHILDPKTLFPARNCQSVTVVSDHGLFSDSIATGIFVLGPEKGMGVLEQSRRKGIIIDDKGGITSSPELEAQVQFS